ncbi:PREDICTED: 52 kDa repressor of the inhibitor of the protein kinase-like [Wasmannia auropunctata]|uniref:52 kDa repressor of the inhibitor of the protein kinase-like n=1 Tax=Wasmannia auropunctata TaxID=64793 RepID=UPI0005EF56F1|nr:PREDICTED: 52 kDa repressor of the inhibitor of the protein kinase-like [Wasmannia auropunctata]
MAQVLEHRNRLRLIIETILFCGRQNIPLRGHRNDGKLTIREKPLINEGNFRALLTFRATAGNETLKKHLENTFSRATYISKTTQNEIIECCKEEIQNHILARVKKVRAYSILFDETTDVAHIEQISLSLRYIHEENIREDFLTFADIYDSIREEDIKKNKRRFTGVALGHCMVDLLKKFELSLKNCVGIGTDNCSVMASDLKGAVQEIIKSCPNAKRCTCFNHFLNNSLAKTAKVISTRNAIDTMKSVIRFSNASFKRTSVFKKHIGGSFSGFCETRWIEKHDSILQFEDS